MGSILERFAGQSIKCTVTLAWLHRVGHSIIDPAHDEPFRQNANLLQRLAKAPVRHSIFLPNLITQGSKVVRERHHDIQRIVAFETAFDRAMTQVTACYPAYDTLEREFARLSLRATQ